MSRGRLVQAGEQVRLAGAGRVQVMQVQVSRLAGCKSYAQGAKVIHMLYTG